MFFKRKIYDQLLEWKGASKGKSAILIEGARRVGKSTIAEEFARNEYDDYIVLDFAMESKDIRQNFEDNIGDLDAFFRNLFIQTIRIRNNKRFFYKSFIKIFYTGMQKSVLT